MKIIYLHHAERDTQSGVNQENDITENGIKEANLLAEKAQKLNIKAIYTSPYLRCKHTAEIINKYINVPIIEDSRFNECDIEWDNFLKRNIEALDDIVKKSNDEDTIVCVTSGVNLSAFICYFYGLQPKNDIPYTQAIACSPICFQVGDNW